MINKLKFFAMMLTCILLNINMVWATDESITASDGVYSGSGASGICTWTMTSCTVVHSKPASGGTNVSSTNKDRWYSGNKITFTPKSGYTISKVVFVGSSNSYNGKTMSSTTGSVSANSNTTTVTVNTSSAFTVTMGSQFRFGSVTITYTGGSKTFTLKVPTGAGGSSYTTYSGKDKSWLTSTKALSGLSCNGDPNPINATYSGWRVGSLETPAASPGTTYSSSTADASLPASGTTLYAVFQNNSTSKYYTNPVCKTYVVWYYGNGNTDGDEPWDDNEYDYGDVATVLGNSGDLEKTGYEFKGWATSSSATAADYVEDDEITISDDVELYAFWCKDLSTETAPTVNVSSATYNTTTSKWDITVTWTAVSGATYYKIACADLDASSYYLDPTDVGNVLTYDITGLTQGTNYRIRVQAKNACGSTYKNGDFDYTPTCPTPGSSTLSTTSITSTGVTASWTSVSGASNYRVIITNEAKNARIGDAHDVTPPTTTSDFTGLTPNTNYYAAVQISNACGESRTVWSSKFTTLQRYTLTYYKNDGGDDSQTAYKDHGVNTTIKASNTFSRTGYTFQEWNTDDDGEGTSYTAGNTYSSNSDLTLYAIWEINSHTLAWNANGGDDLTGTYTSGSTDYNTALTAPDTPTRTGYTFTGWNSAENGTGDAYTGYMPDADVTYYAQWSINSYNVAVADVDHVAITATPASELAIGEGSNRDVNYGKSVTLAYSSLESKNYWGGWKVTNAGGDDVTASVVAGNTLTVPDYAVTVSAVTYGDLIAWCDPQVTVSDGFCLTSYYIDATATTTNSVYTTSAAGNLLTINSTDLGSVDKIEFSYLDGSDNTVTLTSSPFRLCNDGSSNYNVADGGAGSSYTKTGLSNTCALSYSIRYKPTAYNLMDNYKLKMVFKKGTEVRKTIIREMNGRSLPEEFVIAAKFNGQWYALPNTLKGTQAEQGAITPIKITVDNTTTPTAATYAPTTTVYKGRAKYETSNPSSMALTSTGSNYLQTSNSVNQMWLSSSGYTGAVDWYFKSSDRSVYELAMDPVNTPTKKMGIDGGHMGYYATPTVSAIYLLPITNKYTDIPATATEWGQYSVVLAANPGATANKAQARVEDGSPTSDQTITAINAAMGTAKNVKVPVGSINLADLASNEGKLLYIDWFEGSTLLGTSCVTIPRIIAASRDMYKTGETTKTPWNTEVHVLPGATLTANTASYSPSGATVKELHIYPGATLNVSTGTLTATTLRLRNGWTRAGSTQYNTARVYIADDAALTKTTASMDYDIYNSAEGRHYYPLAVPFETAVSSIDYADTYLAGFSNYGASGQYVIKEYDGARRAENGPDQANNWSVVSSSGNLTPGKGYIMTAVPVKGEAIIRIPLSYNDAWTSDGEKGTANYDDADHTKNVVAVTAHTGTAAAAHDRHKGWNMLGVPFMSCYGNVDDIYSGGGAAALINGELVVNTEVDENMEYGGEEIPYVSVPSHDFAEYIQTDITEAELLPGWSFLVQVKTSGNLTFAVANQQDNDAGQIYAPKRTTEDDVVVKTGIILSGADASDKTTILISNQYSGSEYEIGADLEKMFGTGYTLALYSLSGETRLAYNAMSPAEAQGVIPLGFRAPEDGTYTFSLNPKFANAPLERVDLIDYQANTLTNLKNSSYTFTTVRTQNDERFALNIVPSQQTPTDIDNAQGDNAQGTKAYKVIIDQKMYIILGGKMYDATGKRVKEINK